jgi:hypothetical protein
MAPTSIHIATSAGTAAAAQRVAWAERRRTTAATEAREARERLAAAEEQLREARQALRSARALAAHDTTDEVIGMGFFADEIALERAA